MEEQQTFGQWLRQRRREMDLTQEALGRHLGCAQVTIRKIEADSLRPSRQLAILLVEHLGIPADERNIYIECARSGKMLSKRMESRVLHHLPHALTSFIGRKREVGEVKQLLSASRLVTVIGAGGVGKSRLALQVAEKLLDRYPDGVWFVELAPIADADLVTQAVAANLGLQKSGDVSYQSILINHLRERNGLLILDNCEHLLDPCAQLVDILLKQCPKLTILATCRERFDMPGEAVYRVPSLGALNPASCQEQEELWKTDSVQLFVERAAFSAPGFSITEQNLQAVVQICYRLDGIPLAIELAAARTNTLSVAQIVERLEDRFRLLIVGNRTAIPRHRTLRSSIDWSYSMLAEPERLLFQRLSVFSGGWTIQAAEAVCAGDGLNQWEILDALTSLVNKSLVIAESTSGSQYRYHMLETIRQYAQEFVMESADIGKLHDRHLGYFLNLAQEESPRLKTDQIAATLLRLDADLDNFRSALAWVFKKGDQPGIEAALDILNALDYYWVIRALYWESFPLFQRALTSISEDEKTHAERKAYGYYVLSLLESDHFMETETIGHLNNSVRLFRLAGDRRGLAIALSLRCYLAFRYNFFFPYASEILDENAVSDQKESFAIMQEFRDDPGWETQYALAWVDCWNAAGEMFRYTVPKESMYARRALERFRRLGDVVGELYSMSGIVFCIDPSKEGLKKAQYGDSNLKLAQSIDFKWHQWLMYAQKAIAYYTLRMYPEFEANIRPTISLSMQMGKFMEVLNDFTLLIDYYITLQTYDQASVYMRKALSLRTLKEMQKGLFETLELLTNSAKLALCLHKYAIAARLLAFVQRTAAEHPHRNRFYEPINFDNCREMLQEFMVRDEIQVAWKEGQSMALDEAVTFALEITEK